LSFPTTVERHVEVYQFLTRTELGPKTLKEIHELFMIKSTSKISFSIFRDICHSLGLAYLSKKIELNNSEKAKHKRIHFGYAFLDRELQNNRTTLFLT
jgi:hypothetical protein